MGRVDFFCQFDNFRKKKMLLIFNVVVNYIEVCLDLYCGPLLFFLILLHKHLFIVLRELFLVLHDFIAETLKVVANYLQVPDVVVWTEILQNFQSIYFALQVNWDFLIYWSYVLNHKFLQFNLQLCFFYYLGPLRVYSIRAGIYYWLSVWNYFVSKTQIKHLVIICNFAFRNRKIKCRPYC